MNNEIIGLNPEETYLAEKELRIEGEVDSNAVKGSADRIINAILWGDEDETELAKEREEREEEYFLEKVEMDREPVADSYDVSTYNE